MAGPPITGEGITIRGVTDTPLDVAPKGVPRQRTPRPSDFVICGFDGLAFRLAEQLTDRYDSDVVVVMTADQQKSAHDFGAALGNASGR